MIKSSIGYELYNQVFGQKQVNIDNFLVSSVGISNEILRCYNSDAKYSPITGEPITNLPTTIAKEYVFAVEATTNRPVAWYNIEDSKPDGEMTRAANASNRVAKLTDKGAELNANYVVKAIEGCKLFDNNTTDTLVTRHFWETANDEKDSPENLLLKMAAQAGLSLGETKKLLQKRVEGKFTAESDTMGQSDLASIAETIAIKAVNKLSGAGVQYKKFDSVTSYPLKPIEIFDSVLKNIVALGRNATLNHYMDSVKKT